MDLFEPDVALHQPDLRGHISSAYRKGKNWARDRINVAVHQKKKENDIMVWTGERQEKKERNRQPFSKRLSAAFLRSF